MKKLYIILFVTFITFSCSKDDDDLYWEVVIDDWLSSSYPFDIFEYIDAPDGWISEWDTTLIFIAEDPPGWKFVSWNLPAGHSYCVPEPIVDRNNYRKQIIHNEWDNMKPCNMPLRIRSLSPNYIKID